MITTEKARLLAQASEDMLLTASELEKLRKSVNRQTPFGKEDWQHELCREMGMESTLRPVGWPKGKKRGTNK